MNDADLAIAVDTQKKRDQCTAALAFMTTSGAPSTLPDVRTLTEGLMPLLDGIDDPGIQGACIGYMTSLQGAINVLKTHLDTVFAEL